jgi:acetylornithine/succinyldiaminopimelate/putrescine aminotransferase
MLAAELLVSGKGVVQQALESGVIINCTQDKVLRFLPPLIIERRHVDEFLEILRPILAALKPVEACSGILG